MWMSWERSMKKEAIAVHNPSDEWEAAIQDASKQVTGEWLPAYPCQLLAKAVSCLKYGGEWLENSELLPIRAYYLFAPHMISNKQEWVFVTHLLFLRDILENNEINENIHCPISFMTEPLANFLFRDCPVHIYMNSDLLRRANADVEFLNVGGFLIAQGTISLKPGVISDIKYFGKRDKADVESMINTIEKEKGIRFSKAAAKEIDFDVFQISEHVKELKPDMDVWDKRERSVAEIVQIEPGENGVVYLRYSNGTEIGVPKQEFDQQFTIV